jgi:hypothetical protein
MKSRAKLAVFALGLAAAVSLIAGGFVLQIGKPSANPEAQAKNAVMVVRGYACVDQDKTTVKGTAEGIVNGTRTSVALNLIPLAGQDTYAVTQQWPNEGNWVLTFTMTHPRFGQQGAMVRVDGPNVDWAGISRLSHAPAKEDIEAALKAPSGTAAVAAR